VCFDLDKQNIDIAILTEMRISSSSPIHTRSTLGYQIFASYTVVKNQGGIGLAFNEDATNWHIESEKRHGPHVNSCLLVSATQTTPIIGTYLPPGSSVNLTDLTEALN
jgi:hypothetical protein